MFESRIDRRRIIVVATALLLAGCKVIPSGPKNPPPPPPADTLPTDQQRHRIALLVPLSGANADVGQSIANATTMALLDTGAKNIRITTYDTASGPAAAATKAVTDGNRLILGPVQADDVAAIATVARAARIPLISYSSDAQVAARDVFVMGTTPDNAVARTVAFARSRGALRFGLLAPNGDYGARASAAFNAAVKSSGGSVVASSTYDRSNTSILSAAQRLRSRGTFDAILVADGARFAVLAAPQAGCRRQPPPARHRTVERRKRDRQDTGAAWCLVRGCVRHPISAVQRKLQIAFRCGALPAGDAGL